MKSDKELIEDMKVDILKFIGLSEHYHLFYEDSTFYGQACIFRTGKGSFERYGIIIIASFAYYASEVDLSKELPFLCVSDDNYFMDQTYKEKKIVSGKHWWNDPIEVLVEKTRRVFRFTKELYEFCYECKEIKSMYEDIEIEERQKQMLEKYKSLL